MRNWIIATALVGAVPALAQEAQDRLTVTGQGRVAVEPDIAHIRVGVGADADTARAAAEALASQLNPVLEGLAGAGIAPADIQTGTLQLGPVYAENQSRPGGGAPEIAGYRAESLLTVRLGEIDRVGEILDAATGDGANRLEGISFALSDPEAAEDAALAAAVADAMRKARITSEAAGRTLGPIRSIVEQGERAGPEMMRMSAAADIPVAPGKVEATAQVEITYTLGE